MDPISSAHSAGIKESNLMAVNYDELEEIGLDSISKENSLPLNSANLKGRVKMIFNPEVSEENWEQSKAHYKYIPSSPNVIYTPFKQKSMIEGLNPDWLGSCNILSHSWMLRKIQQEDFQLPTTYKITQLDLPHPVIVLDNSPDGDDIAEVESELERLGFSQIIKDKHTLERKGVTGIEALISGLDSQAFLSGTLLNTIAFSPDFKKEFGHACAFVKKGNECSWFDPNYGEVTFKNFSDFSSWFRKEATDGVLIFLLSESCNAKKIQNGGLFLSDLYPPAEPTCSEQSELSKHMIALYQKSKVYKQQIEIGLVADYTLFTYSKEMLASAAATS